MAFYCWRVWANNLHKYELEWRYVRVCVFFSPIPELMPCISFADWEVLFRFVFLLPTVLFGCGRKLWNRFKITIIYLSLASRCRHFALYSLHSLFNEYKKQIVVFVSIKMKSCYFLRHFNRFEYLVGVFLFIVVCVFQSN